MTDLKKRALEILDQLNCEGRPMEYRDYSVIFDALDEIESLRCRDEALEQLWARLEDVPMNPETECIEEDFVNWPAGTHREDIWHWFDERHSKGVAGLMYGGSDLLKFRVRISQLRYGDVEVEATDEKAAKTLVAFSAEKINWFDSETTDMTVERIERFEN